MGVSDKCVALHGINKCQRGIMICIITVSRAHPEKAQSPPQATTRTRIPKKRLKPPALPAEGGRRLAPLYHELHLLKTSTFTPVSTSSRLEPQALLLALEW